MPRAADPAIRAEAVRRVLAGETAVAVSRDLGIGPPAISKWVKAHVREHLPDDPRALTRRESEALRDGRAEDLVFLLTRGGEYHEDNLCRRLGVEPGALDYLLQVADRRDLVSRIVRGDGHPVASDEREDGEYFTRYALRASDYREKVLA